MYRTLIRTKNRRESTPPDTDLSDSAEERRSRELAKRQRVPMQATSGLEPARGQALAAAGGWTVQTNGSVTESDQTAALGFLMEQAQPQAQAQAQAQEGAPTSLSLGSGQARTVAGWYEWQTYSPVSATAQEHTMGSMMPQAQEGAQAQAHDEIDQHQIDQALELLGGATHLQHIVPGQGGPTAGGQGESESGSVTDAKSDDSASCPSLGDALSEWTDAIFGNAGDAAEPVAVATALPLPVVMAIPMPSPNLHAPSPANVPAAAAAVVSVASLASICDKVTSIHGRDHERYSHGCPEAKQFYKYEDIGGCGSLEPDAHYGPLCKPLTDTHTTFPFWDYAQDWQYNTAAKQKAANPNLVENNAVITMEQQRFKSSHSIADGYSTKQPFAVKGDPLNGGAYFLSNRKEGAAWQTTLVQVTNCDYEGLQAALGHMRVDSKSAIPGDDIPPWARLVYLTDAGSGDHFSITPLSYTVGEENGLFKDDISSKIAPCTVSDPEAPFKAIDTATGKPINVHPSEERYHKTSRLIKGIDGDGHVLTHIASDGTLAQALLTRDQTTSSDGLSRAVVHWAMHTDLQSAACTGGVAKKGRFFRLYTTPANPRLRHLSKLSAHSPAFLISTLPGRSTKRKARPPGMVDLPPRGGARNA